MGVLGQANALFDRLQRRRIGPSPPGSLDTDARTESHMTVEGEVRIIALRLRVHRHPVGGSSGAA